MQKHQVTWLTRLMPQLRNMLVECERNPLEACGLLLGGTDVDAGLRVTAVSDIVPVANSSDTARTTFAITVKDAQAALKAAGAEMSQVVGSIHTHPKGSPHGADPSQEDVALLPSESLGMVLHVASESVAYYDHENGYLGRINL